jgi:CRISPR/Cas system-associated exonuclease Cas4 (RecB family)
MATVTSVTIFITKVMRISRQPHPIKIMIDQKQLQNVEYFNYLGSMITNYAICKREIKSRIVMAKAAFNKQDSFHQKFGLKFKEENSKMLRLEHSFVRW